MKKSREVILRKKGGEFIMNYEGDNMKPFLPKEARILDVGYGDGRQSFGYKNVNTDTVR